MLAEELPGRIAAVQIPAKQMDDYCCNNADSLHQFRFQYTGL
jgi:hypothetical protein